MGTRYSVARDLASLPHCPMGVAVDLPLRFIVGRDNQRALRRPRILPRDLVDALRAVPELTHATLPVEFLDSLFHFAGCQLLDRFFEHRILLPPDLFKLGFTRKTFIEITFP